MKKKNLRLRDVNWGNALTVGELKSFLQGKLDDDPVVLKCGCKNYRLNSWDLLNGKLILHGGR